MAWIAWTLLVLCCLIGLIGILVPAVPGSLLILVGVVAHKFMLPSILSWWTVGVVAVGVALTFVVDFMGSFVGAKWGGATKWGLIGLTVGGIVGIFFGIPGLLLGPLLGVFIAELVIASRTIMESTKAGVGATVGLAVSTLLKFLLSLILVVWTAIDAIV